MALADSVTERFEAFPHAGLHVVIGLDIAPSGAEARTDAAVVALLLPWRTWRPASQHAMKPITMTMRPAKMPPMTATKKPIHANRDERDVRPAWPQARFPGEQPFEHRGKRYRRYRRQLGRTVEVMSVRSGRLANFSRADEGRMQELREPDLPKRRDRAEMQPRPRARRALALPGPVPEVRTAPRGHGVALRHLDRTTDSQGAARPR